MPTHFTFRDLTSLEEFGDVVELERQIWGPGYTDVVPVPILAVSVHRGGILIGGFEGARMVAFVYSLPGIKDGRATQWSHMAGVVAEHRNAGLGRELKSMQRDRALAMGIDLIEWTYDPLQAMNAHLNFTKLGVIVDEYAVNLYGESSSPLHRGLPTDRFVAQWRIQTPHVARRLEASGAAGRTQGAAARPLELRAHDVATAARANGTAAAGEWLECTDVNVDLETDRVAVEIPMGFTEMLSEAPEQAQRWRLAARRLFTAYFARGYQAVDFFLDRGTRRGTYLLARP